VKKKILMLVERWSYIRSSRSIWEIFRRASLISIAVLVCEIIAVVLFLDVPSDLFMITLASLAMAVIFILMNLSRYDQNDDVKH
jgi:hypothetical protein